MTRKEKRKDVCVGFEINQQRPTMNLEICGRLCAALRESRSRQRRSVFDGAKADETSRPSFMWLKLKCFKGISHCQSIHRRSCSPIMWLLCVAGGRSSPPATQPRCVRRLDFIKKHRRLRRTGIAEHPLFSPLPPRAPSHLTE